MRPLELLLERNSAPKLTAPGPGADELAQICRAALRAPDHARLRPWRLLVISGQGLNALGDLMVQVAGLSGEQAQRLREKPLRAPMIIAVACRYSEHPKVPLLEQQLSAGCAAHSILLAAEAQGYGAIWRTGELVFNPALGQGLGLAANEQLLGFIYLGTRASPAKPLADIALADHVSHWPTGESF